MGTKRLRVQHVNDLGRDNHRQTPARAKKSDRREHERHPGVCVLCETQTEPLKHLLGPRLKVGWQILVAHERGVAKNRAESRAIIAKVL